MSKQLQDINLKQRLARKSIVERFGGRITITILILAIALISLITNPKVIKIKVLLKTKEPFVTLKTNTSGTLERLYYKEGDLVKTNDQIAQIKDNYKFEKLQSADTLLQDILTKNVKINDSIFIILDTLLSINFQNEYNELYGLYASLNNEEHNKEFFLELNRLRKEMEVQYDVVVAYERKMNIEKKYYNAVLEKFNLDSLEYAGGFNTKQNYLQSLIAFRTVEANHGAASLSYVDQKKFLEELEINLEQLKAKRQIAIEELRNEIERKIKTIREKITDNFTQSSIIAPINGKLYFLDRAEESHYFEKDKILFAILPQNPQFLGEALVHESEISTVQVGQKVRIYENYNVDQDNFTNGIVTKVYSIPEKDNFKIEIKFLHEEYNFNPESSKFGEIIVENKSLLEKLTESVSHRISAK